MKEIQQAEVKRQKLVKQAADSFAEAEARRKQLQELEARQAAAGLGSFVGPIGALGSLAAGRQVLQNRKNKVEEEARKEAERAAKAVRDKAKNEFQARVAVSTCVLVTEICVRCCNLMSQQLTILVSFAFTIV